MVRSHPPPWLSSWLSQIAQTVTLVKPSTVHQIGSTPRPGELVVLTGFVEATVLTEVVMFGLHPNFRGRRAAPIVIGAWLVIAAVGPGTSNRLGGAAGALGRGWPPPGRWRAQSGPWRPGKSPHQAHRYPQLGQWRTSSRAFVSRCFPFCGGRQLWATGTG